jgi:hypothetical protein
MAYTRREIHALSDAVQASFCVKMVASGAQQLVGQGGVAG